MRRSTHQTTKSKQKQTEAGHDKNRPTDLTATLVLPTITYCPSSYPPTHLPVNELQTNLLVLWRHHGFDSNTELVCAVDEVLGRLDEHVVDFSRHRPPGAHDALTLNVMGRKYEVIKSGKRKTIATKFTPTAKFKVDWNLIHNTISKVCSLSLWFVLEVYTYICMYVCMYVCMPSNSLCY